jgi:hypothetical protein
MEPGRGAVSGGRSGGGPVDGAPNGNEFDVAAGVPAAGLSPSGKCDARYGTPIVAPNIEAIMIGRGFMRRSSCA